MAGWRGILGFDFGIVQAPLGPDISGPKLVAAVAKAGCLGFLGVPDWDDTPDVVRELIRKTRGLTNKRFGVGITLGFSHKHKQTLDVILEERVPFLQVNWVNVLDDLKDIVRRAHAVGTKVVVQTGTLDGAREAIEAGVDAIIAQGREAGGPVHGQEGFFTLVPKVADLIKDSNKKITLIAAGGLADARGYVAALSLGADGICLGTRFVASEESNAHPKYKDMLLEFDTTEYSDAYGRDRFPNAPHRILDVTSYDWTTHPPEKTELHQPIIGRSAVHGRIVHIQRFSGIPPNKEAVGNVEDMVMYAGQGVALIKEIRPADAIIRVIVEEARKMIPSDPTDPTDPPNPPNPSEPVNAVAVLIGNQGVSGTISFTQVGDGPTVVSGSISGLSPGLHGFHVHEYGDTSNGCASTGPHFNPNGNTHGAPQDLVRHAGDLGNLNVPPYGPCNFQIVDNQIPLSGPNSIIGRAIVVHADPDDLGKGGHELSPVTGNAGARVACGIIGLQG